MQPPGNVRQQSDHLLFWMLAASTSFRAQIATLFGVLGNFKLVTSTEELPIIVAIPSLVQPLPKSAYSGTSIA
ncbi:MAG TPA: hypothetical protein VE056_13835, partial [Pyrinomonadaceae bacterium]|nr:hypothetical protein [Pyrinomonadaceae bacterium]